MDPNVCLQQFLEACEYNDRDEAIAALEDLLDWLNEGGSLPETNLVAVSPEW